MENVIVASSQAMPAANYLLPDIITIKGSWGSSPQFTRYSGAKDKSNTTYSTPGICPESLTGLVARRRLTNSAGFVRK